MSLLKIILKITFGLFQKKLVDIYAKIKIFCLKGKEITLYYRNVFIESDIGIAS